MIPRSQQTPGADADGREFDGRGAGEAAPDAAAQIAEVEEVDALPVLQREVALDPTVRARFLARERSAGGGTRPAVQAAAVAAGSFVAGAAVAGIVHRRQRRSPAQSTGSRLARALGRSARKASGPGELMQIVGTRTLLVDVHLLGIPDAER